MFSKIVSLFSRTPAAPVVVKPAVLPVMMRFEVTCNNELVEVVWGTVEQAREKLRKVRAERYETRKGQWTQVAGPRSTDVSSDEADYQAYLQACSWKVLPPGVSLRKAA